MNINPNRKTVFNPTPVELSWRWDGVYYYIAPNGTLSAPLYLAEHLLKHLSSKGLRVPTAEEAMSATYKEFAEEQVGGFRAPPVTQEPVKASESKLEPAPDASLSEPQKTEGVTQKEQVAKCNVAGCEYTNSTENGVIMHQRMKHREVTFRK